MTEAKGYADATAISIGDLRLDPRNPRLQLEDGEVPTQMELAQIMADIEDALVVARSIARRGFYPWEVLVVVPDGDSYVVVEGNRRLTALLGLLDPEIREGFADNTVWDEVASDAEGRLPEKVPCVVVETRGEAQPALGYRHISGIEPWRPYAQAQYIAHLIENEDRGEVEVAEITGKPVAWVRQTYRNFRFLQQAAEWGNDTSEAEETFSLVDVALSSTGIKQFVGMGSGSPPAEAGLEPVSADKQAEVAETLGYIFGTPEMDPLISDSREIRKLAKVLVSDAGLEALRGGKSLAEALVSAEESDYDPAEVSLAAVRKLINQTRGLARELERASSEQGLSEETLAAIDEFAGEARQILQYRDSV